MYVQRPARAFAFLTQTGRREAWASLLPFSFCGAISGIKLFRHFLGNWRNEIHRETPAKTRRGLQGNSPFTLRFSASIGRKQLEPYSTSKIASVSTGMLPGSTLSPMAERVGGSDLLAKQVDQQLCSAVGHLGLIVELRHGGHKTGDLYRAFTRSRSPISRLRTARTLSMEFLA